MKQVRIFLIAGEHSGDALGAKLIAALKTRLGASAAFSGVGGSDMAEQGLSSIFPIEDVAVMGPLDILPKLPRIVRRVYQAVDAAISFRPDVVVIIDSPEFTHPIARRIRKRAPSIPIVDYVSPSVWAWRPGRAKRMRAYIDHVLCLLPFEPDAHYRLGGPECTYVGHPLIERLDDIRQADAVGLAQQLNIDDGAPVLLVLPGSRTSEVSRLLGDFGETVGKLSASGRSFHTLIPAVPHLRATIEMQSSRWRVKPNLIGADQKYAAMRLSRAALAASGTVTLELSLAGTPSVVAYKTDKLTAAIVRRLVSTETVVLPNLVLGENVYPEFIQEDCTPDKLQNAVAALLDDTPARAHQLHALARIPAKMRLAQGTPSEAAADAALKVVNRHAAQETSGLGRWN